MALLGVGLTLQTTLVPAAVHWPRLKAGAVGALSLAVWFLIPIMGFGIEVY
jgi:hypothetical protein